MMSKSPPYAAVILLLSFLSFIPGGAAPATDLDSDAVALLRFRAGLLGGGPDWNTSASPCSWQGISCSGGRVVAVRLPGRRLAGPIAAGSIGNLTALQVLSLRSNFISGSLPLDLSGGCPSLQKLNLQMNMLSGAIPSTIFSLAALADLDLSFNRFSGGMSVGFANLAPLRSLYLQQNDLSGEIPDLNLPNLVRFNVSYNRLTGSVPPGLRSMPATAFLGMPLCGAPLSPCRSPAPPPSLPAPPSGDGNLASGSKEKSSGLSGVAIAGIAVGSAVLLLLLLAVLLIFIRRRKSGRRGGSGGGRTPPVSKKPHEAAAGITTKAAENRVTPAAVPPSSGKAAVAANDKKLVFVGGRTASFDLDDLLRASAEVMGKGTHGIVYKAMMGIGKAMVVKRLSDVTVGHREFREVAEDIGSMDDQSLVHLLAFFYSRDEKLLVYDFMPGGSISSLLHGNRDSKPSSSSFSWDNRLGAALSAARGISYIHLTGSSAAHGNIKSSNVLFDTSGNARVIDQCLSLLAAPSSSPANGNASAGGYRAPEAIADPRLAASQKADVYSFGVLLLELLTGRSPTNTGGEATDLPRWVRSASPDGVFEQRLLQDPEADEEGLAQMLQIALDCTASAPGYRPQMSQVVDRIAGIGRPGPDEERRRRQQLRGSSPDAELSGELSFRLTESSEVDSIVVPLEQSAASM